MIASLIRRVLEETTVRHLHAGAITVDLTAKTVTVADTPVPCQPPGVRAARQVRQRAHTAVQQARTGPLHQTRPTQAGAGPVLITRWAQGWALTSPG